MELIFFYIFAGLAVATAIGVVAFKNPISSAFSLVVSFFAVAAIYAMLQAHFLAAIQVLVYAGAIMVLFVFVIMLLNLQPEELKEKGFSLGFKIPAIVFLTAICFGFIFVFCKTLHVFPKAVPEFGTVKAVGKVLFTTYWFPFEFTSILLLVAIIGGVVLAKREL